jgi:hypothetical protein
VKITAEHVIDILKGKTAKHGVSIPVSSILRFVKNRKENERRARARKMAEIDTLLDEQFADIDRRAPAVDEAKYGLTHQQVYLAIWRAGLSTEFIRENFILTDDGNPFRRYYRITEKGYDAIKPYLN